MQLRLADFQVHPLAAVVHFHAEPGIPQLAGHLPGVLNMPVGDGDDHRLHRRQPQRKRPGVMLHQHPEKPFQRPQDGAMHHIGAGAAALVVLEHQVKAFRQVEVELHRSALPRPAQSVGDFDVNFGAVERAAAFINGVGQSPGHQRFPQRLGGVFPHCRLPHELVGPGGQHNVVVLKPEGGHHLEGQVQHIAHLAGHLVGQAENVGIILREPPHPHQPVQHAAALVAIDGA